MKCCLVVGGHPPFPNGISSYGIIKSGGLHSIVSVRMPYFLFSSIGFQGCLHHVAPLCMEVLEVHLFLAHIGGRGGCHCCDVAATKSLACQ